jgi:hypothetical protein
MDCYASSMGSGKGKNRRLRSVAVAPPDLEVSERNNTELRRLLEAAESLVAPEEQGMLNNLRDWTERYEAGGSDLPGKLVVLYSLAQQALREEEPTVLGESPETLIEYFNSSNLEKLADLAKRGYDNVLLQYIEFAQPGYEIHVHEDVKAVVTGALDELSKALDDFRSPACRRFIDFHLQRRLRWTHYSLSCTWS